MNEQRAILVGLRLKSDPKSAEPPLAELRRLAETAGAVVVGEVLQNRERPDATYLIGKGKANEIAELARAEDALLLLFDNDLSPSQESKLEKLTGLSVVDRTRLILDIFATRARTRQARLQVELAQLIYQRSRLKRMWTHLARMEGAIGTRGPGEKQIEEDRRLIDRRIQQLRRALDVVERRQTTRSAARQAYFTCSLVGYTNAGKSTLLRRLTGSETFAEDKLFATLDTQTRAWELPGNQRIFLSDTVGFIRNLPHDLVASFHSTLAEAVEADLLLHVVDASSPAATEQMTVVERVLTEIGAVEGRRLTVFNKVDAVEDQLLAEDLFARHPSAVRVSARTGQGISELERRVSEIVQRAQVRLDVRVPAAAGRLLAFIADRGNVLERRYEDDDVVISVRVAPRDAIRIREELAQLTPREA